MTLEFRPYNYLLRNAFGSTHFFLQELGLGLC